MTSVMNLPSTRWQTSRSAQAGSAERLRELGDIYLGYLARTREVSTVMEREIMAARDSGQSLADVAEAAGLSIAQIEYVLVSVDYQRRAPSL